jgi:glycosyltransferase involved in cell wall biosynthesis
VAVAVAKGKEPVKEPGVVVIVPLYNEATVIGQVISDLRVHFSTVVCVDDGSTDNSAEVARQAGAAVISHPLNLGQGAALQTGIVWARTQPDTSYLITFDGDGQHRVDDVVGMLAVAREKNLAIVFGSRFLDRRTQPGFAKKTVLKVAVLITRLVTGLKLTDAHNGLRVIRRDALDHVNLIQDRMSHATEIVQQLATSKKRWREYPVEVLYTEYSKKKGQSLLNSINILFDLIVR